MKSVVRMTRNRRARQGFTLVEMGVGLLIGAILLLALMGLYRGAARLFRKSGEQLEALQAAQIVSEIIKEDLQYAVLSGFSGSG